MQLAEILLRQICVNKIFSKNGEKERKAESREAVDKVYHRVSALSRLPLLGEVVVGPARRTIYL